LARITICRALPLNARCGIAGIIMTGKSIVCELPSESVEFLDGIDTAAGNNVGLADGVNICSFLIAAAVMLGMGTGGGDLRPVLGITWGRNTSGSGGEETWKICENGRGGKLRDDLSSS